MADVFSIDSDRIVRAGHAALARIADPIADPVAPAVRHLAAQMADHMERAGGVGLAAPQLGVSLRMVVFFVPASRVTSLPGDSAEPLTVLINPVVEAVDREIELGLEGCLSLPGLRGVVPRFKSIRYRGFTLDGNEIDRTVSGFHARVVQHEVDHLDGILYPARMTDLTSLVYVDEVNARGGETANG